MENNIKHEAREAYNKFIRSNRSFFSWFEKKEKLQNFEEIQKINKAFTGIYLGVKTVAINKIVGSVQKYTDFDKNFVPINQIIEARWCNIYKAFIQDEYMPLVQLYKIKDSYFVYDGNHRISVANYLNFLNIEAEVTEFLPSKDEKEEALYREKLIFEKEYGVALDFTEVYFFGRIRKEIKDFGSYLKRVEAIENLTRPEKAKLWHNKLYKNAYKILEINNMQNFFQDKSLSDIYIYYLEHKYYESEKKGRNIGYYEGLISFVNTIKSHENKALDNHILIDKESQEYLKKVEELDFRYNTLEIYKHDLVKEHFGENNYRNYRLLKELNELQYSRNIYNFLELIEIWKKEIYVFTMEQIKKRVSVLEEEFIEFLDKLLGEPIELYFSIKDYEKIYLLKYKEGNCGGVVNYILDIFIPIVSNYKKNKNDKLSAKDYFSIFKKYLYLIKYNPNVSIAKAIAIFNEEKDRGNYSFYEKLINKSKIEIMLDFLSNSVDKPSITSFLILNDLMDKYGIISDYGNLLNLYEYINLNKNNGMDMEVINKKMNLELKLLLENDDINNFYKTKYVMDKLAKRKTLCFLEFYQVILYETNYMEFEASEEKIVEIAINYINEMNI